MSLEMKSDDANMINDILNELNEDTSNISSSVPQMSNPPIQLSSATPTHGSTYQPQNLNGGFAPPTGGQIPAMPNVYNPRVGITTDGQHIPTIHSENESKFNEIFRFIRKPLIISVAVFFLFNSYTRKLLSKNIPALFASTSMLKNQGVTLVFSIIIGFVLLGVDKLL